MVEQARALPVGGEVFLRGHFYFQVVLKVAYPLGRSSAFLPLLRGGVFQRAVMSVMEATT